jgi:hypothetical protein
MRKSVSLSLDELVLKKLEGRCQRTNRSLSREVETILKKVLRM